MRHSARNSVTQLVRATAKDRTSKKKLMNNTDLKHEGSGSEQSDIEQKNELQLVTDEQLEGAGLIKVTAFIRGPQSAAAARKAKQRAKEAEEGVKQLNLKASVEHHDLLKEIAASIQSANAEQKKLLQDLVTAITNKTSVTSPATSPVTIPQPAPVTIPAVTPTPATSTKPITGVKGKIVNMLLWCIARLTR
jgi:hypothetical protein